MRRRSRVPLQLLGLLAVSAGAAFATPTQLDPPAISQGVEATTLIQLEVTAGASGAPNGFTVEWIPRTLFDALGGWPADPLDPRILAAAYLGTPSLNITDGTTSFLLGPGQSATVEIGDVFDETGVVSTSAGELAEGTEYAIRARANGEGGITIGGGDLLPPSENSVTYFFSTRANGGVRDCVRSQGYWKTHPTVWPVSSLRLGSIVYTKTQLLAIWHTPAAGNGLVSLAHQLMAAKLNVLSGAVASASVTADITAADALIGALIVPPIGTGYLKPGSTSGLTDGLEAFNTEEGGDVECHVYTAARPSTWGRVKSLYR